MEYKKGIIYEYICNKYYDDFQMIFKVLELNSKNIKYRLIMCNDKNQLSQLNKTTNIGLINKGSALYENSQSVSPLKAALYGANNELTKFNK